ncbi:MAG: DNA-protecting protein DprA [Spirochaetaceae bacterium]|jgi:DNA processing protein|nr:DNA-protecting protein DprA [Spirochaetaceae bacterium]
MSNTRLWLGLLETPGIDRKILKSAAAGTLPLEGPWVSKEGEERAEEILEASEKAHIRVLTPWDGEFPARLRAIPSPPLILFVKGSAALLREPRIAAAAGSVSPGAGADAACRRVVGALCRRGFAVVSGLARGCDTLAHQCCLEAGGMTVAVLAHGLDYCYPRENRPLADAILDRGGLLLSEYPPGVRPRRNYFVARDRLQSGLGRGLCVIETGLSGGTMHTVRFAEKQGRPIGCVPCEAPGSRFLLDGKKARPLGSDGEIEEFIRVMEEPSCHRPDFFGALFV